MVLHIPQVHQAHKRALLPRFAFVLDLPLDAAHVVEHAGEVECILETSYVELHGHIEQHHVFLRDGVVELVVQP